ncbi:metal ion Hypothetical protein [Nesidiocoris tenuis]|uniref:Nucleoporin NUP42 n=1 Tax=Nesidiocoris tenuis TaxID=355587 RepID=A0ABN7BGJ8_9HEMI|nr:metal ion Hypothetical protein [Nesidiocoris tenuis]
MSSGVVCRFYANGNCRFGASCWNIHESPDGRNRTFKTSSYHAQADKSSYRRTHYSHSDVQELVEIISEEAKQVEYGHMWPLTCLSVVANIPQVTGWDDFSMEELRYHAYSAKAGNDGAGRFNDYVEFAQKLKLKAKENRLVFLKPGKMAHDLVRRMVEDRNEKNKESSFTQNSSFSSGGSSGQGFGSPGFSSSGGSVFGFAAKDPAPGLFAMASQGFKSSPFSQPFSQGNDSINDSAMETAHDFSVNFAQPVASSTFQQNVFGAVPSPVPFGATPTANPFGTSSPTASPFGAAASTVNSTGSPFGAATPPTNSTGNPFGAATPATNSTGNPFGAPTPSINSTGSPFGAATPATNSTANPFGAATPSTNSAAVPFGAALPSGAEASTFPGFGSVQQPSGNNNPAYTPLAELTEAELEQFKATTFTLQNLPLRPPPPEMC